MSTRARVVMTDFDGADYTYSISCDGYPDGVVYRFPPVGSSYEKIRQALNATDFYEEYPDYIYEIDVPKRWVKVYNTKFVKGETKEYPNGFSRTFDRYESDELLFEGTFEDAQVKYPR